MGGKYDPKFTRRMVDSVRLERDHPSRIPEIRSPQYITPEAVGYWRKNDMKSLKVFQDDHQKQYYYYPEIEGPVDLPVNGRDPLQEREEAIQRRQRLGRRDFTQTRVNDYAPKKIVT